ncbi:MAG: DUF3549 family protein [Oleibacter sp.]|nr:DUF3549 family protein [Thalassolituus sp.]
MTISQFVSNSGAQMRVFDLGRRISKIAQSDFEAIENLTKSYPSPYLQHAWLGILSWNPKEPGQHNIWFLKLPLDEQNYIQPGPRDAFLQHWLKVAQAPDQQHGDAPCHYKPDTQRMAYFHATAVRTLKQPASKFYETSRAYISGDLGWDNWQQLGLQGLAEVVVRLDEDNNARLLTQAFSQSLLPQAPRNALLNLLENATPDAGLSVAITDNLAAVMATDDEVLNATTLSAFCRALSSSVSRDLRQQTLSVVLAHPLAGDIEMLSAIGSRCWQDLFGERLLRYLELLAAAGNETFMALIADLMTIPSMRERIMGAFRDESRSEQLSNAIGYLFSVARSGSAH